MTLPVQDQTQTATAALSDKEINFRKQEEMFNKKLDQERQARQQAEERLARLEKLAHQSKPVMEEEDDVSDEPYVDHRRLQKAQAKMERKIVDETDSRIQKAVQGALAQERQTQWLNNNPDFYEVMNHAQDFADKGPRLAETILAMPEGFERQKLVYESIKALGMHRKEEARASGIQEKIEQNRRTPYYQPTGVGSAPYAGAVGFDPAQASNPTNQKNSYAKMKELQSRLGIFN